MQFLLSWIVFPVLLLVAGFAGGWEVKSWQVGAQQTKQAVRVVTVTQKEGAVSTKIAVAAQAAHDRLVYRTQTLIEKVPEYVTAQADRNCIVSTGFVRLWNTDPATVSETAGPSSQFDDASAGVALSAVGAAAVDNHGRLDDADAQVRALQAWITAQVALINHK